MRQRTTNAISAAACAALLSLAAAAGPADAQEYRHSIGWNVGAVMVTSLNDGIGQVSVGGQDRSGVDLDPGLGIFGGLQYDRWYSDGLWGVRFGGSYARHELEWSNGDREVYTAAGTVELLLRLGRPDAGSSVLPYLGAGLGGLQWGLGEGRAVAYPAAGAEYLGDEDFQWTGVGSFGLDFITPWSWDEGPLFVRFEVQDVITQDSPLSRLTEGDDFGMVHSLRASVGLHHGIGYFR